MAEARSTVRPARGSDIPALRAVLWETFEGTWLPQITAKAAQRYVETDVGGRYVDQSWREFVVAEIDGEIAGLIHWRGDFIEALHVRPGRQGQGIGRRLLSHAEQAIAAAGFGEARLEADTFNVPAQRLYRAIGYVEKNRYPDDEWDSGFTTILFAKPLGR